MMPTLLEQAPLLERHDPAGIKQVDRRSAIIGAAFLRTATMIAARP
jgi:hypothetical protein